MESILSTEEIEVVLFELKTQKESLIKCIDAVKGIGISGLKEGFENRLNQIIPIIPKIEHYLNTKE